MSKSLKITIKPELSNNLDSLANDLKSRFKDIEINIDSSSAIKELNNIESRFKSLKKQLTDPIKVNIKADFDGFGGSGSSSAKSAMTSNRIMNQLGLTDKVVKNVEKYMSDVGATAKQNLLNKFSSYAYNNPGADISKMSAQYNNELNALEKHQADVAKKMKQHASNIVSAQYQIKDIQNKIDSGNYTGTQVSIMEKQISGFKSQITEAKRGLKELGVTQTKLGMTPINKQARDFVDANNELVKSVANSRKSSSDILKAISEQQRLARTAATDLKKNTVSETDANARLIKHQRELSKLMGTAAYADLPRNVRENVELSNKQIQNAEAYNRTLKRTSEIERERKASYKDVGKELDNLYKVQDKRAKLEALINEEGVNTNSKQSAMLKNYEAEISAIERTINAKRELIKMNGLSSSSYEDELNQKQTLHKNILNDNKKLYAEQASNLAYKQTYDDIIAGATRQEKLLRASQKAGFNESKELQRMADAEEARYKALRERVVLQGRSTSEIDEAIAKTKTYNQQLTKQEEILYNARNADRFLRGESDGRYRSFMGADSVLATIDVVDILQEGKQLLTQAFDAYSELDEGMVNIKKVLSDSDLASFDTFAKDLYKNASSVGKSATEYALSVERWATQGKSLAEAQVLGRYSTIGSFVGNIDEAEMVNYMSVPLKAYEKSGLQATDVLNAMNEVANESAVEMDDLGAAYQRAAATAAQTGTSFAELTGLITAAQDATRVGGEKLGTAFKTIDINFGKMSSRETKADRDRMDFFKELGVEIVDANGELRSTYDILHDLEGQWSSLTDQQRNLAGFYAAGKHYGNIFSSLMTNWKEVERAKNLAMGQLNLGEQGSAFEEFNRQQDSIKFKMAELKNSWMEFMDAMLGGSGSEFFKNILDGLNNVLDTMNKVAENDKFMGGLGKMAMLLGGLFATDGVLSVASKFFGILGKSQKFPFIEDGEKKFGGLLKAIQITSKNLDFSSWKKAGSSLGTIFGGVLGNLGGILSGLGGLTAAFITLNTAVDIFTGKDIFGHIGAFIDPVQAKVDTFKETIGNMEVRIQKNNEIMQMADEYYQLSQQIDEAYEGKKKLYEKTGNIFDLELDPEVYTNLQAEHNKLVQDLDLPVELKIDFNNYDDIVEKMNTVKRIMAEMRAEAMIDNIDAIGEGYTSYADTYNKALDKNKGKYELDFRVPTKEEVATEIHTTMIQTGMDVDDAYQEVLKQRREANRKSLAQFQKDLSEDFKNIMGADEYKELQEYMNDTFSQILDDATYSGDASGFVSAISNAASKQGQVALTYAGYSKMFQETIKNNKFNETLESLPNVAEKLVTGDMQSQNKAKNELQILYDSLSKIEGFTESLGEGFSLKNMTEDIKKNGIEGSEMFKRFQQSTIDFAETANQNFAITMQSIDEMGRQIGLSEQQISSLKASMVAGDMAGFVRELGNANNEAAAMALNIGSNMAAFVEANSAIKNIGFGDVLGEIQTSIDQLPKEVTTKLNLVNNITGETEWNNIYNYLQKWEGTVFEAELGLVVDGEYQLDKIDEFIMGIERLQSINKNSEAGKIMLSAGVEFDQNGFIDMESLKKRIEEGKIQVSINADGELVLDNVETPDAPIVVDDASVEITGANVTGDSMDKVTEQVQNSLQQKYLNKGVSAKVVANVELVQNIEQLKENLRNYYKDKPIGPEEGIRQEIKFIVDLMTEINPEGTEMTEEQIQKVTQELESNEYTVSLPLVLTLLQTGASFEEIQYALDTIDGSEAHAQVTTEVDKSALEETEAQISEPSTKDVQLELTGDALQILSEQGDITGSINITANTTQALESLGALNEELGNMSDTEVNIKAKDDASTTIDSVSQKLDTLAAKVVTPKVSINAFEFFAGALAVEMYQFSTKTVRVVADTSAYVNAINNLPSKTVTISIAGKSKSVGIGETLGQSFSQAIGSTLGGNGSITKSFSNAINRSYSKASDAKVNEDVWRYWSKELFSGLNIENALDDISSEMKKAREDSAKMLELYRQQISLTQQQIAYEKEMGALRQQELTEIIGKLKGYGFQADGNRITNLSIAKNLSGEKASEADKLLSDYKSLYTEVSSLNSSILKLQASIVDAEKDIEDIKKDKEAEKLGKIIKSAEDTMKALSNHLDILNTKEGFVGDSDYNLKIAVNEENVAATQASVAKLIEEFNKLSATGVEFEDNATDILGTLEDLAGDIIDNADSILEFNEAITELKIQSLMEDFDRFGSTVERNADIVDRSIDKLQQGLLDGFGSTELGGLGSIDFNQKTALERSYQNRLQLEADLNKALENYSKKNIDRTVAVANTQLQIARDTYAELLKIQSGQTSNGLGSYSIGITQVSSGTEMTNIQKEMLKYTQDYQKEYNKIISAYDKANKQASSYAEKQAITRQAVIEQLKLQDTFNTRLIDIYKQGISLTQEQLDNDNLTTEQRRELIDRIDEYTDKIADAQDKIRDAIKSRFDYEFELMDKAAERAERHSNNLTKLIDVAKLVNLPKTEIANLYDGLFDAHVYQYALARKQLESLQEEQKKYGANTYEWNLIEEKILSVTESVKDLGIQALNTNKSILDSALDALQEDMEKGMLGGRTKDQWDNYHQMWMTGIEKELKLEEMRLKALGLESSLIQERLSALDLQDEISRKDLEYLDKQLKVIQLQEKLNNIKGERNQQVLTKQADGTWAFDYVADQTEYDKTKEELNAAESDLEKYRREQRGEYVSALGTIISNVKDGKYKTPDELRNDLTRLNDAYGGVLTDIPGMENMTVDQIVATYQEYLQKNQSIASDLTADKSDLTGNLGVLGDTKIDTSLLLANEQFAQTMGNSLRSALGLKEGETFSTNTVVYRINSLTLPNVTNGQEFVEFFNTLPAFAEQKSLEKDIAVDKI